MLHFIHVGKCAGTSIGKYLSQERISFLEYHCYDANQKISELLQRGGQDDFYLIGVRDPIKRYISAFYWDLFEKRMNADMHGPERYWSRIYNFFSSPNMLAEALTSSDPEIKSLAEAAFHKSKLHMELSLAWYVQPELAGRLTKDNSFIIRTENADADMSDYILRSQGRAVVANMPREKSDYQKSIKGYDIYLSEVAVNNLKLVYRNDYAVLEIFTKNGLLSPGYAGLSMAI